MVSSMRTVVAVASLVSTAFAAANGTGPVVDLGYARFEGTRNVTLG